MIYTLKVVGSLFLIVVVVSYQIGNTWLLDKLGTLVFGGTDKLQAFYIFMALLLAILIGYMIFSRRQRQKLSEIMLVFYIMLVPLGSLPSFEPKAMDMLETYFVEKNVKSPSYLKHAPKTPFESISLAGSMIDFYDKKMRPKARVALFIAMDLVVLTAAFYLRRRTKRINHKWNGLFKTSIALSLNFSMILSLWGLYRSFEYLWFAGGRRAAGRIFEMVVNSNSSIMGIVFGFVLLMSFSWVPEIAHPLENLSTPEEEKQDARGDKAAKGIEKGVDVYNDYFN